MNRRLVSGLALAAAVAAAACTEQPQEQSVQGPSSTAAVIPAACDPNAFNSLINNYFSPTKAQEVRGYKDLMIAALSANPEQTEQAKDQGFNILREIGLAARAATQPPASTGSQLAVEVLECIYPSLSNTDVIKSPPGANFFVNALTRDGGGFDVRGGTNDPTGPVQAFGGNPLVVVSGVAPQTTSTWDGSLTGRVLFYGEPGAVSGYHWDVVPRAAVFDPALIFTTCVDDQPDPNQPGDPTLMLSESGVGYLAFVPADHVGCGGAFTAVSASAGRFNLLQHLASLGRALLVPQPAAAATVMPGVVGGSAKGAKSLFDVDPVAAINLSVFQQPPKQAKLGEQFTMIFQAKTPPPGPKTVNGTTITVTAVNNSGVPTVLNLDPDGAGGQDEFECGGPTLPPCAVTTTTATISGSEVHGIAQFFLRVTNSPGGLKFLAEGDVVQRDGVVTGTSTNKINIKP